MNKELRAYGNFKTYCASQFRYKSHADFISIAGALLMAGGFFPKYWGRVMKQVFHPGCWCELSLLL